MPLFQNSRLGRMTAAVILILAASLTTANAVKKSAPPVKHSQIGETVTATDGSLTITNIGKKQNFDYRDRETLDEFINSPKSVNFHPDGTRYYVNSLEGCATVVYDMKTGNRLKVIQHKFASGTGPLWSTPSGYYEFTHYPDGQGRAFMGKPVENAFSHDGRYLWVPYYRRTFDINAQDPSAVAIIDTQCDSIVRMMETGPLPKFVACSHNGKYMAITHWGNNTVALVDISSPDPKQWHHLPPVVVDKVFPLNYSLTKSVDRDSGSGLMLRGTVFTPDDRYLLIACMGGGGIAVIDMSNRTYLGKINGITNARHLLIGHGYLYASCNSAGLVMRLPMDSVINAIGHRTGTDIKVNGWEKCQVGYGARTIELSPSGKYVFAACNTSSALYVVDTKTMSVIANITVDSYPVGLHVSQDGQFLVTTSQGRQRCGGNSVNLFKVTYADPKAEQPVKPAEPKQPAKQEKKFSLKSIEPWMYYTAGGGVVTLIVLTALFKNKNKNNKG